jgi:hypothetical protein
MMEWSRVVDLGADSFLLGIRHQVVPLVDPQNELVIAYGNACCPTNWGLA